MSQLGWRDPASGDEKSFEEWLAEAEAYGSALGMPFEILHGIWKQSIGEHRPDGVSATMLLGCSRRVMLEKLEDFYTDPHDDYAAFRGVIGHSMLEANAMAEAVVERRMWRMHKGVALSGQLDKVRLTGPGASKALLVAWLDWCDAMFQWEQAQAGGLKLDESTAPAAPKLPRGVRFRIEDWKTKDKLPDYQYVASHYQEQGNIYRWLLRVPKDDIDISFVFVSMTGVKSTPMYNGGKYVNGRSKPEQIWSDEQVEDFLDARLLVLAASQKLQRPVPYAKVPVDDLWECNYCPLRRRCYELAAEEAYESFLKGDPVPVIAPRDKAVEEKAARKGRKVV